MQVVLNLIKDVKHQADWNLQPSRSLSYLLIAKEHPEVQPKRRVNFQPQLPIYHDVVSMEEDEAGSSVAVRIFNKLSVLVQREPLLLKMKVLQRFGEA